MENDRKPQIAATADTVAGIRAVPLAPMFKLGDVVRLKSGGPAMSVLAFGKRDSDGAATADCAWHDGNDGLETANFPLVCLRPH